MSDKRTRILGALVLAFLLAVSAYALVQEQPRPQPGPEVQAISKLRALMLDNYMDQIVLTVQGHSTQTSSLIVAENSAGTDVLTVSNAGAVVAASSVTADSLVCTNAATFGGGYGSTGCTISTEGVLQCNGAITGAGALTIDNIVCTNAATFGGGFGTSGATISTGGAVQADGLIFTDSTLGATGAITTASSITGDSLVCTNAATFGGGFGSSGVTISTAGAVQADGLIFTDSTLGATGAITTASSVTADSAIIGGGFGTSGATISTAGVGQFNGALTTDGALTADSAVIGGGYGSTGCSMSSAGVLQCDGAATFSNDVTVSGDSTGGNALAKNEFIGLPRIKIVGIGTMANGITNTVLTDIGDSETPATDWTAITGNTVMSNDSTYYRQGTASLKMAISGAAADGDGCVNALAGGDQNWTDDEGFGFWFYTTKALDAGDITLEIHDVTAVGGFTDVNVPAATANAWQWLELDVTLADNNLKDVITDLKFTLSAAGAAKAAAGAFDVYFDFIVKWDVAEEESLGVEIPYDGVLSVLMIDATTTGATSATLVEYTDYFVHYQSGNDAVVMITDQSGADKVGVVLVAYN